MSAARAFVYLRLTSFRNNLRSRLLRLKQPKYLFGAIVGALYIYYFFVRRIGQPRPGLATAGPGLDSLPALEVVAASMFLLFAALAWILPSAPAGLAFSEAEIAFLFPAPVRRRTLIHFRLLGAQLALLMSSLILALISARWSLAGGNWMTRAFGWWIILAALNLNGAGSSFAIARLLDHGVTAWPRRLIVMGVIALALGAAYVWFPREAALAAQSSGDLRDYIIGAAASGPLHWLLAVPKLIIAPFVAADPRAFLMALGPAFLVLAALYAWVIYSEVAFEEASIATAARRAARLAAMRSGNASAATKPPKRRPEPFRLHDRGNVALAFLWKNLLSGSAFFKPRNILICAAIIVFGCRWLAGNDAMAPFLTAAFALSLVALAGAGFLGPMIARNDLRGDLPNADILKTYPLKGWQIVFGELLAPAASLTSVVWLALLLAVMAAPGERLQWLTAERIAPVAIALAVLAPLVCMIQLIVLNGLTILFPAWVKLVGNRGEYGFDVLGQRLLFVAAQVLVVLLTFLPASLIATLVVLLTLWFVGPVVAAVLATLAIIAGLAAEIWIGVQWLGRRFEKFDLSAELRP